MNRINRNPFYYHVISLACAVAIAGCGGGGGGNDVSGSGAGSTSTGGVPAGSGSTTTASTVNAVTTGPISGFGSIIINGTRYDDSTAKITLDDDSVSRSADLRLGMMVQVESERSADDSSVRATSIAARSYLQGPITSIATGVNRLTVLGVTVTVTPSTVFDNVANLSALAVNDKVEIHGIPDAAVGLIATRIEKSGNSEARLIGTVQNASATTFTLGGITVQYEANNLIGLSNVTNGTVVRVKGNARNATTVVATAIRSVNLTAPALNGQRTEVEGIITSFTDATHFSVNGRAVIVGTGAVVQGTPAIGARVEVTGTFNGTALAATKVEVKNQEQVEVEVNELHGAIFSVGPTPNTFTLRNGTVSVRWDSNTVFDASLPNGGNNLTANLQIEVKGRVNGNVLLASRIKLDK
jgi:cytoskeletal protein CcmA (bactofilin family)